jgi:hypothetical protein
MQRGMRRPPWRDNRGTRRRRGDSGARGVNRCYGPTAAGHLDGCDVQDDVAWISTYYASMFGIAFF